jgi:hypothetical protein
MAVDPEKEFEANIDDAEAEFEASLTPEEEFEAGLEPTPVQPPLAPEEAQKLVPSPLEATAQFVQPELEGAMTGGATALGIHGAQKAAEKATELTGIPKALKKGLDPEMLAARGVGVGLTAKSKKQPKLVKQRGKTAIAEGLVDVTASHEERFEKALDTLDDIGTAIGEEQKKASDYMRMEQPGAQHKLRKGIGGKSAKELRKIAGKIVSPRLKGAKAKLLADAAFLEKGIDLDTLDQFRQDMADVAYSKHGEIKDIHAHKAYKALQEIRVSLIEGVLKEAGDEPSNLKKLNKRYRNLKELVESTLSPAVGVKPEISTVEKFYKKSKGALRASIIGSVTDPSKGLLYLAGEATDPQTIERALVKTQLSEAMPAKALKTAGKVAKGVGKGVWKSLPVVGFAAAYSTAKAAGATEAEALTKAAIEEIPGIGDAYSAANLVNTIMDETKVPEELAKTVPAEKLDEIRQLSTLEAIKKVITGEQFETPSTNQFRDMTESLAPEPETPESGRRARLGLASKSALESEPKEIKKSHEVSRGITEMSPNGIRDMINKLRTSKDANHAKFEEPLANALEGNPESVNAKMFALSQRPEFREMVKKLYKIKEEEE